MSLHFPRGKNFVIILSLFIFCLDTTDSHYQDDDQPKSQQNRQCGYESCPKTEPYMLNVHIVPHTHNDVGWLKTIDQYYYGTRNNIQYASVRDILDFVVKELSKDPKKRFIYVESVFFFMWWSEQTHSIQKKVQRLVDEGRLEFVGGGWSMNDEATTYYQSIIDQLAWGLRRLNDTFGECGRPRVGWQIDPFGHSREMASIFAQMGFDGLFLGRLDYQDKEDRLRKKTAEMIWKTSKNLGDASDIFTGVLYNQYQPPPGFCFDVLCGDELIIDAEHNARNNVNRRVDEFLEYVHNQWRHYRTNNVIITMGGDFTYQDAALYYTNLDKLIRYSNERQINGSNINVFYSTPSCYLKSLHDAGISFPTKEDDFFPYASDPHSFWTGYFTSRPTLKRYERIGNHFLQVCKQLTALAPMLSPELIPNLNLLRETMGVMQHHDAVTGTEKQHVASDYAQRLDVAIRACGGNTKSILNFLTTGEEPKPLLHKRHLTFEFSSCHLLNISKCDVSEQNDRFIVTLYNPLSHPTTEYVRVPVPGWSYRVEDLRTTIEHQIVPIPLAIQNLTFRNSLATYDLVFLARELPPFGYKSFYITKTDKERFPPNPDPDSKTITSIGNEHLKLTFDVNGFVSAITIEGITHVIKQEFFFYESATGNNRKSRNRSSGAYIFRPKEGSSGQSITTFSRIRVYRGDLVKEVHQEFNEWITQVVRVYRDQLNAEFEWLIGPIPIDDGVGKEVVVRFDSNIKSKGVFYTDSNGREMIKRVRDHRDTWKVKLLEHIAGNYYPVGTKIALEDENLRMAILTDRAQGGSSMKDGSLELMVHRRLLHDDAFGVGEALSETAYGKGLVARGTHHLFFGSSQINRSPTLKAQERFAQLEKLLPSWKFFSNAEREPFDDWRRTYANIFTSLTQSLPKNVHLLTFEPWHENEILVRFEHIFETDEDPEYSKVVQFNLKDLLHELTIQDVRETTLDGNVFLVDRHRFQFKSDDKAKENEFSEAFYSIDPESILVQKGEQVEELDELQLEGAKIRTLDLGSQTNDASDFIIELNAMEVRTFLLSVTLKG